MDIASAGNQSNTKETELTLAFGAQRAVVSPYGASLRRYFVLEDEREIDIVWGYLGSGNKLGGQGDVLCPFPGRVANGRYVFDGQTLQLECNDKEGPNAIHGFVRSLFWTTEAVTLSTVSFTVMLDGSEYGRRGYPFTLNITVAYALDEFGLSCRFAIQNGGSSRAPVGIGFHPYFTVGPERVDEWEAQIPASHYLEFADTLAPTGNILPVQDTAWDYRNWRSVGQTRFNHCYVHLQRDQQQRCRVSLQNPRTGRSVTIEMDNAFTALVVYTGDAIAQAPRRALAIEPMTCATDALNHPDWGLKVLSSNESFEGSYKILRGRRV